MARFYTIYPSFTYSIYTSSPTEQHSPKRSRSEARDVHTYIERSIRRQCWNTRGVIATVNEHITATHKSNGPLLRHFPPVVIRRRTELRGGRKKNHANSLKWWWWRRRRQVWILNNWGRVRPSSPCPAAMRPFFWKSQHKIDVDEAIVVNSLNVTRNGASKKYVLYTGCKIFRTL